MALPVLSDEKEKKIRDFVLARRESMVATQQKRREPWKTWIQHANSEAPAVDEPSSSALKSTFIPETRSEVRRAHAALAEPFVTQRKKNFVEAIPRTPEGIDGQRPVEQLLQYDFDEGKFGPFFSSFALQMVELGTSPAQVIYDVWYETRMKRIPWDFDKDGFDEGTRAVPEETEFRQPKYVLVDLFNFYPDPAATSCDVDEWFDCAKEFTISRDALRKRKRREAPDGRLRGVYFNLDKIEWGKRGAPRTSSRDSENSTSIRLEALGLSSSDEATESRRDETTGFEWWGELPAGWVKDDLKGDAAEEEIPCVVTLEDPAGEAILIRAHENQYWHRKKPFVVAPYEEQSFQPYGMGIPEELYGLQCLLNSLWNKGMYSVERSTRNLMIGDPQRLVDKRHLQLAYGLIETKGPGKDVLTPVHFTPLPAEYWQVISRIPDAMQQATSITRQVQGGASTSSRATATQVMNETRQGLARVSFLFQASAAQAVKRFAELTLALEQQYMDLPKIIRVAGPAGYEWPEIHPLDIQHKYDFLTVIDPNRADEGQQAQALTQLMGVVKDPFFAEYAKPGEILKRAFELHSLDGVERMLKTEEEVAAERAQKMAMAAQAQGGVPGAPPPPGGLSFGPKPGAPPPGRQEMNPNMISQAHQSAEMAKPGPRPRGPGEMVAV